MPTYEFVASDDAPADLRYDAAGRLIVYEVEMTMGSAPPIGASVTVEGEDWDMVRIASLPNLHAVKTLVPWNADNPTIRTNVNGKDIRMQFVDHPHTDPGFDNLLNKTAQSNGVKQTSGMRGVYRSEKFDGRLCVDVASNVPDPLGEISRGTRKETVRREIKTPVKTRKAFQNR